MVKTSNNIQLHTQHYLIENPKASVLIIHGLAEHSGRYEHVARALNKIGADVYTFDLRGHGRSEGPKGLIADIDEYREDVENVYRTIPKKLPLYILGHSMGGLIALRFLTFQERNDIAGAIFSGAALEIGDDITPLTINIVKVVGKFFPNLRTTKLNPESISRDPKAVLAYATDPLIHHDGAKAGLGLALINGIKEISKSFSLLDKSTLIMHGGDDKITNIKGSKALYDQCMSTDKSLKIWDGAYHEIFQETNKEEVIQYMADWLSARI